jgi:hypothetical protein
VQYINSIPFGAVTRLDGVLNVAAHYPTNANPPDLGPKGYFSEISDDEPGGNGSTKLHMVSRLVPHFTKRCGRGADRFQLVVQDVADGELETKLVLHPSPVLTRLPCHQL